MEQYIYPFLRPLEPVLIALVNRSLMALWVVAAVLVLRLVFRKTPKWVHCTLWALVALRLIVPFTIASPVSVFNAADVPVSESGEVEYVRYAMSGVKPSVAFKRPKLVTAPAPADAPESLDGEHQPARAVSVEMKTKYLYLPSLVVWWLLGVAAMLVYALVSFLRLRKRVAASIPLGKHLWLCDDISSPFILGVFRPRVYLPSDLDEAQRDLVVAHERAHLARHDHWWKPLGFLLLAAYWFNPGLWLAYVLLCRDIELACDERVLRELGSEVKKSYSEALLVCSVPRHTISACPVAFGEVGVKQRVRAVLNWKRPAFWLVAVAVAACAVAAACFLTNPIREGVRLTEQISGDEESYYVVSARLRRVSRGTLSQELAADLAEDFARWDAQSDEAKLFSSYGPGGLVRTFDGWDEAVAYLGHAMDNPLEGAARFRPVNWSGWDAAESDDEDWQRHVQLVVEAGRGGIQTASLHAGYRDGETRVQLQAMLFCDRRTFTASPAWTEYMRFDAEKADDILTVYAHAADEDSPYDFAQGTLWLVRNGILYKVEANSTGGSDEAAVRAALERLRAAFKGETATPVKAEGEGDEIVFQTTADLDHDGADESVLVKAQYREGEDGERVPESYAVETGWETAGVSHHMQCYFDTTHMGEGALYLCRYEGEDCLLRYTPYMAQGMAYYRYDLFFLAGDGINTDEVTETLRERVLEFTLDEPESVRKGEMDAFSMEMNELLAGATLLISTLDGEARWGTAAEADVDVYGEVAAGMPLPFREIWGVSGWYTDVETVPHHYTRGYYAYDAAGEPVQLAESYGFGIEDYVYDLDGDGLTELICNCVSGGDGHASVWVFRRNGNMIEVGFIDYPDKLPMPDWLDWGLNSTWEVWDDAEQAFFFHYAAESGEGVIRLDDYTAFTFTEYAVLDRDAWPGQLVYDFAGAVNARDVERYIGLFCADIQEEMRAYVAANGSESFFRETSRTVLSVTALDEASIRSNAWLFQDVLARGQEFRVYGVRERVTYPDGGPRDGEQENYYVLVNEDGGWRLYRIAAY